MSFVCQCPLSMSSVNVLCQCPLSMSSVCQCPLSMSSVCRCPLFVNVLCQCPLFVNVLCLSMSSVCQCTLFVNVLCLSMSSVCQCPLPMSSVNVLCLSMSNVCQCSLFVKLTVKRPFQFLSRPGVYWFSIILICSLGELCLDDVDSTCHFSDVVRATHVVCVGSFAGLKHTKRRRK